MEKQKVKVGDLMQLNEAILVLRDQKEDGKPVRLNKNFSRALFLNEQRISADIGVLKEILESHKKTAEEYQEIRTETLKKLAVLDDLGEPVVTDNEYTFKDEKTKEEALGALVKINDARVVISKKEVLELEDLATSEVDIDSLEMVDFEFLPENIEPEVYKWISIMVKE